MFRVEWLESALDELATLWADAGAELRERITAAAHGIELRLEADALNEGESRPGGRRLTFAAPLAVTFHVAPASQTATILHVRIFRQRAK